MKKILVTGATGFVGSELVRRLVSEGYKVRCLVRKKSRIDKIEFDGVEFWYGNVEDKNSLKNICDGIDTVFHLAAIGDINAVSKKDFLEYKKVNVEGTKNVLSECLNSNIKQIFHFSSMAAMGNVNRRNILPSEPCNPTLPYEVSKYESERVFDKIKAGKMKVFIIRPCMIYDWTDEEQKEATKIIKMVRSGIVFVPGDGNNLLNIINRKSLISKLIEMMEDGGKGGVHIMVDETITFNEFIRRVSKKYNVKNLRVFHIPKILIYYPALLMEYFAKIFGFKPVMTTKRLKNIVSIEEEN